MSGGRFYSIPWSLIPSLFLVPHSSFLIPRSSLLNGLRRSLCLEGSLGRFERRDHPKAIATVAAGRAGVADAFDEVAALPRQRLLGLDAGDQDVAEAQLERDLCVRGAFRRSIDPFVVEPHLLGRFHVIEYGHLAAANEGEL